MVESAAPHLHRHSHTLSLPCLPQLSLCSSPWLSSLHSHMMVKHLRLGTGLMLMSLRALVMIVCIWERKKRARSGLTAPGTDNSLSMARLSCGGGQGIPEEGGRAGA